MYQNQDTNTNPSTSAGNASQNVDGITNPFFDNISLNTTSSFESLSSPNTHVSQNTNNIVNHTQNAQEAFNFFNYVKSTNPESTVVVPQDAKTHDESVYTNIILDPHAKQIISSLSQHEQALLNRLDSYTVQAGKLIADLTSTEEHKARVAQQVNEAVSRAPAAVQAARRQLLETNYYHDITALERLVKNVELHAARRPSFGPRSLAAGASTSGTTDREEGSASVERAREQLGTSGTGATLPSELGSLPRMSAVPRGPIVAGVTTSHKMDILDSGFALSMALFRDTFNHVIPISSGGNIPLADSRFSQSYITDNSKPVPLSMWNMFNAAMTVVYGDKGSSDRDVLCTNVMYHNVFEMSNQLDPPAPIELTQLAHLFQTIQSKPLGSVSMSSMLQGLPYRNTKVLTWLSEHVDSNRLIETRNEIPMLNFCLMANTFVSLITMQKTYIQPVQNFLDVGCTEYKVSITTNSKKDIKDVNFLAMTLEEYMLFYVDPSGFSLNAKQTPTIDNFRDHIVVPCTNEMLRSEHFLSYLLCYVMNPVHGAYEVQSTLYSVIKDKPFDKEYACSSIPYTCQVNTGKFTNVMIVVCDAVAQRRRQFIMRVPVRSNSSAKVTLEDKKLGTQDNLVPFTLDDEYQKWLKVHIAKNNKTGFDNFVQLRGMSTILGWMMSVSPKGVFERMFALMVEMSFRTPSPKQIVRTDPKNENPDQSWDTMAMLVWDVGVDQLPDTQFLRKVKLVDMPAWDTPQHKADFSYITTSVLMTSLSPLCLPPQLYTPDTTNYNPQSMDYDFAATRADNLAVVAMFVGLIVREDNKNHNFTTSNNFHEFAINYATVINAAQTAGLANAGIPMSTLWGVYLNSDKVNRNIHSIIQSIGCNRVFINRDITKQLLELLQQANTCTDANASAMQKHYSISHYPMPWFMVEAINAKFGVLLKSTIPPTVSVRPLTFDEDRNLELYSVVNSIQINTVLNCLNYLCNPTMVWSNCHSYKGHPEQLAVPISTLSWDTYKIRASVTKMTFKPTKNEFILTTATFSLAEANESWFSRRHMSYVYNPLRHIPPINILTFGYPDPFTDWLANTWRAMAPYLKSVIKTGYHVLSGNYPEAVATLATELAEPFFRAASDTINSYIF